MAETLNKGDLFPPVLVPDLISKVKGHSSLALLSAQEPMPFNGTETVTFDFDTDIDVVAESGAKGKGGVSVAPIIVNPVKVEYGARVSDEFMYGSEEYRISILQAFADGFAKKMASGFDIMAFHGLVPRGRTESTVINTNCFDKKVTNKVIYDADHPDQSIESAIAMIEAAEYVSNGLAISPKVKSDMSKLTKSSGEKIYPEFAFGGAPAALGSSKLDSNTTVAVKATADNVIKYAYAGDFANCFKWGYAKEIPMEVIQYGDPDGNGDLKRYNQVYIRCEAYIGWGIFDPAAFARVASA